MVVRINTRARVGAASTAAKPAPKKPAGRQAAPAKKTASKAPATKTAARTPATRKTAVPVVKDTPVRKSPAKAAAAPQRARTAKPAAKKAAPSLLERRASVDPKRRIGGLSYKQISELTGYGLGSEQFIATVEIMKGGTTRIEVGHRIAALLPSQTRSGTPKQVSNLVSGVINNLTKRGFTVNGTWRMAAPKQ